MRIHTRTAVLLVIDVQNDFCELGHAFHRSGRDLAPIRSMVHEGLLPFLQLARNAGLRIVFVAAHYPRGKFHADGFTELCIEGTPGAEFYALRPSLDSGRERVLFKSEYDAFSCRALHQFLQEWRAEQVLVTGLTTPSCIRATVMGAATIGYEVILLSDLVAAAAHRRRDHEEVLEIFRAQDKVQVVTSEEIDIT